MQDGLRGLNSKYEVPGGFQQRDFRNTLQKFSDFLGTPNGFLYTNLIIISLMFVLPSFGEILCILSLSISRITSKKEFRLPFRMPKSSNMNDSSLGLHPKTQLPQPADGISFFGNEKGTKKELWFNNDDLRTHILIFGSTGAGKTESLLSLAYNALVQGSGLIYVDGKGENVLYTKVFSMARTMGREDDILCINYMTGARDVFGPQEKKLSNTLNPFSSGGSGGLTELLVSLMDGDGGGDMWKGRAISLISAIMMALVYMRDQREILLDVDSIREHLILDNIIKLYKTRTDFPPHISAALRAYLVSLPGYQPSAPKQNDTVLEQHGYLQMQFTKILGSLSEQYGFIFKTNLGEVDFKDVVLNRRILVVLLPALEKSTDELANLGKIIVACLKQMMASALGSSVEGTYDEIIETKPTKSDMPFTTVLDEYGYYAVKGSAVMPAQARSLGFSMIFAGQDLPAFEKASKEEAASIVANCNIKICMKLEDPKDTFALFEAAAAKALTPVSTSLELKDGGFTPTYIPTKNISLDMRSRIDMLDLRDQKPGEAHILFKSAIVRAQMFYSATPQSPYFMMNYFVRVEPPDLETMQQLDNGLKNLYKNITNENKILELLESDEFEQLNIQKMQTYIKNHNHLSFDLACFATIAQLGKETFDIYDSKLGQFNDDDTPEFEDEINIFTKVRKNEDNKKSKYDADDEEDEEDEEYEDEDINIFLNEEETRKDIENIEMKTGKTSSEAQDTSNRVVDDLKQLSKYPSDGRPETKEPEEIMDMLNSLEQMFDEDN